MFEWHKKEAPFFTGIARGAGGFGFGGARAASGVGSSQDNPASSGVALWDLGVRTSGLYYISTANGGVKQVYVDLSTQSADDVTGKAGWMLVGSWTEASEWTKSASTSNAVFNTTAQNRFSSNFGDTNINFMRVKVNDTITTVPSSSIADFYFYRSTTTTWKRWWTSDGTSAYTSATVNGGVTVIRNALIQFTHAYNLKYAYKASTQVWNNLADATGVQGNWDTGLTSSGTSIGYNSTLDGSLAIIPSGDTSTGAGQDCSVNNAKFGYDDDDRVFDGGSSSTYSTGVQNSQISGNNQKLWMWIK
jgi:hypothetical protein